MSDNRDPVYTEGDRVIYRASSVGLCEEALVAIRMGITPAMPPDWFQEKLDEGTSVEDEIVSRGLAGRGELLESQVEVEVPVTSQVVIRGHTDGLAHDPIFKDKFGVEAKKLGPRLFSNWKKGLNYFFEKSPYYRDQLTLYMTAQGIPFLYLIGEWDPEEKKVIDVHDLTIESPPGDIDIIKQKILRVEARARRGDLGTCDGKKSWPCPVYYIIHETPESEQIDDGEFGARFEALAREYMEAQRMESAGKKAKDESKKQLVKLLQEKGHVGSENAVEEIMTEAAYNGFKVSPYVHTYTGLSKEKMAEDGIDISHYEYQTKTLALRVTEKKG